MSDILSQFYPEQPTAQQPIVTIDTPFIEDDEEKRRQKAEDIALIAAYGENLGLYRELEIKGQGRDR